MHISSSPFELESTQSTLSNPEGSNSSDSSGNSFATNTSHTSQTFRARVLAEFAGTFVLLLGVFLIIGARGRSLLDPVALDLGRYATLGLMLFVTISYFDDVSAHFNPAVSLAHAVAKKLSWRDFAAYSFVQTVASLLAAITASVLVGGPTRRVLPNAARVSSPRAFLYELGATLLLVAAYFASEHRLRSLRPVLIGAAGVCAALTIGRFTTLGLNPARSLGPAVWNRFGTTTWIFVVAPLLGGLAVGLLARITPMISSAKSSSPSIGLALRGMGEFSGTFLTLFLGLAGIRAVGGVIGMGIFFLGPSGLLFAGALLLRSTAYFNPAITAALAIAGRLKPREALVFVLAQLGGAVLAVQALRSWLQGETRGLLPIVPTDRLTTGRLFVLEALAAAIVICMALRHHHHTSGPAMVAAATFATTSSIGLFARSNANPAWAIGTACGWTFTTEPHRLFWLVGAPLLSAVVIGFVYRRNGPAELRS